MWGSSLISSRPSVELECERERAKNVFVSRRGNRCSTGRRGADYIKMLHILQHDDRTVNTLRLYLTAWCKKIYMIIYVAFFCSDIFFCI